ncbi:hypothetical protein LT493_29735 [Streptomyces tricolor]|nr:hypothetical protein [Streptomyces tricolor]
MLAERRIQPHPDPAGGAGYRPARDRRRPAPPAHPRRGRRGLPGRPGRHLGPPAAG